ncbi:N-6 DNA methylase [Candidatus Borrarchaeum sp.]|uniref:Eco57I restriction-modification methylase domain-containing protein n=1 Tax=Candidatus Borrarchaeum sp. TaxID=2846742 RepID=UPI00257A5118|nr:N-6 DNA methylase [Candidatus Borrarchaeum sp.]
MAIRMTGTNSTRDLYKIDAGKIKQQGIYYTPSYIVQFILENTLKQLLTQRWQKIEQLFNEEKYDEIVKWFKENSRINVIDPACGSGIFLIEAKKLFSNYYNKIQSKLYCIEKNNKYSADVGFTLADLLSYRKIIEKLVLEHIYGCELDSTALKNTLLNLKPQSSKPNELTFFNENIVLSDFLISGLEEHADVSIFQSELEKVKKLRQSIKGSPIDEIKRKLQTQEKKLKQQLYSKVNETLERYFPTELNRIIPFNCEIEFPEVISDGGFDVLIGNPPYFTIEGRRSNERTIYYSYLKESQKWKRFFRSNSDIYYYFIIQSLKILKNKGYLGFIVGQYFLENDFADRVRKYVLDHALIEKIIHFESIKLFPDANTDTCILILRKEDDKAIREQNQVKIVRCKKQLDCETVEGHEFSMEETSLRRNQALLTHIQRHLSDDAYSDEFIDVFLVPQRSLSTGKWVLSIHKEIIDKIEAVNFTLTDCCHIGEGFKTGLNEAFIVDDDTVAKLRLEGEILVPLLRNSHISRYYVNHKGFYLIYTTNKTTINQYTNVKKYLERFRASLENRFQFKDGTCNWYSLSIPQSRELFDNAAEKIFCPYRARRNTFAYDNEMHYGLTDTYIIVPKENCEMNINYLLALLNSQVLDFWYHHAGKAKGRMNEYFTTPLSKIPIRKIDFTNPEDVSLHNNLIDLVTQLISRLKTKTNSSKIEKEKNKLQTQIDQIVYRLYDTLTLGDIKIIEKTN